MLLTGFAVADCWVDPIRYKSIQLLVGVLPVDCYHENAYAVT
jgi:hypothetical protein